MAMFNLTCLEALVFLQGGPSVGPKAKVRLMLPGRRDTGVVRPLSDWLYYVAFPPLGDAAFEAFLEERCFIGREDDVAVDLALTRYVAAPEGDLSALTVPVFRLV